MACKKFERKLVEWFESTKKMVPESSYKSYMEFLKKAYPESFKDKEKGRPKAKEDLMFFAEEVPFPSGQNLGNIEDLMNLWGDSAKEWAKMALCFIENGIIPLKKIKAGDDIKTIFDGDLKSLYNSIKKEKLLSLSRRRINKLINKNGGYEYCEKNKLTINLNDHSIDEECHYPKLISYDSFIKAIREIQENEIDYPDEERRKDKERFMALLPKLKEELKEYWDWYETTISFPDDIDSIYDL